MKRTTFCIAFFLLLGTIINVAVAWGCAMWIDVSTVAEDVYVEMVFEPYVYKRWTLLKFKRPGATFFISQREADFDHGAIETHLRPSEVVPTWTALKTVGTRNIVVDEDKYPDGRGWPNLSLWCEYVELPPGSQFGIDYEHAAVGGIEVGLSRWGWGGGGGEMFPRALPLRPIWPGFAINTVFYAAILWLLTLGPFTARRLIRHKRGRCAKCGYDLRHADHAVCPECGATT